MIFIFLSTLEKANDNKEFSPENSKPRCESRITVPYVEHWNMLLSYLALINLH